MIRAVIFDIDGTLLDSVDLHAKAWQDALAARGHPVAYGEIRKQIGKGGDQIMPLYMPAEKAEAEGEAIADERSEHFKRTYLDQVKPFPDVRELFDRIRAAGLTIALASSGTSDEIEHYVKIAGIEDLYDASTSADDAERSKPHPDIFEAAIKKLKGIDVSEMVAIGDTPYDAEAAGKAGLKTIGVLCGGFPEADLRAAGCVAIYAGPTDLLARFDEWAGPSA